VVIDSAVWKVATNLLHRGTATATRKSEHAAQQIGARHRGNVMHVCMGLCLPYPTRAPLRSGAKPDSSHRVGCCGSRGEGANNEELGVHHRMQRSGVRCRGRDHSRRPGAPPVPCRPKAPLSPPDLGENTLSSRALPLGDPSYSDCRPTISSTGTWGTGT